MATIGLRRSGFLQLYAFIHHPDAVVQIQDEITRREIGIIRNVKSHTPIPLPTLFHYDFNSGNGIGAPYILMEAGDGFITRIFGMIEPGPIQEKVYRLVALTVLQLVNSLVSQD